MREIKFRVWYDGEMRVLDKMMVGVWELGFSDTHYVDLNQDDKEDAIVMQYTGLKDKNGKEIYEGDIVKELISTDGEEPWGNLVVTYQEPAFTLREAGKSNFGISGHWSGDEHEIIGNIYENPELLGEANT